MTLHGIIPVWKPKGLTSHDVVGRIRRLAGQKRVGHTGTLDPEVEGVLPICLGQATRLVEYIQDLPKRYKGTMVLGVSTDTEDQTGTIVEQVEVTTDLFPLEKVIDHFQGEIEQVPPMYSAVKIKGERLYELARKGKVIERPSRRVTIYRLDMKQIGSKDYPMFSFDVTCSKGTYVRTLCVDIGKFMGYPAHMNKLIRVQSGPFQIADCYTFDELDTAKDHGSFSDTLVAMDEALCHLPAVVVSQEDGKRVLDGNVFDWDASLDNSSSTMVRIYDETGRFYAIYEIHHQELRPVKVFRDVHE
ncbi:tRNA pseudouridine(55) synthase TruB [Shimazuella sp. AN120528]|uniref:tRNA pseudouridine(55) synthase TruB n=1 Tax=Shimazuella soli TaxID=1892854 RepID=UPI001F0D6D1E|nr:tRNA pseudouridine(55) synthase TruB [Shimazuella soli]MCH5586256.1 tRNA pseudouridine(55) synthase TruB [Shimazuella soli]